MHFVVEFDLKEISRCCVCARARLRANDAKIELNKDAHCHSEEKPARKYYSSRFLMPILLR